MTHINLNKTEVNILKSCKNEIVQFSGCEFGIVEDIKMGDLSQNQFKGYLSQLVQKSLIKINDEGKYNTFRLTLKGCEFLLGITTEEDEIKQLENIRSEIY
jgi:predicted transcriptional regulator